MSTRPQFSPYPVIEAGDMSANITGKPTIIQKLSMVSYSIQWVGTAPVGTFSVEVSNDFSLDASGQVKNAGTWTVLPLLVSGSYQTTIPISGNADNGFVDVTETSAYAIRPIYTFGSGVGSLNVIINGKVA